MAHFAQLNENNIVQNVIVVSDNDCAGGVPPESESAGQAFIASIGLDGVWKQTSYNTYRHYDQTFDDSVPPKTISSVYVGPAHRTGGTPFRGQYAGIGNFYDADLDEFVTPPTESVTPDGNN
jgi:hypothetical protein